MVPRQFTKNNVKYWLQAVYIYIKNHRGYLLYGKTYTVCISEILEKLFKIRSEKEKLTI